jgi:hypothetical protein
LLFSFLLQLEVVGLTGSLERVAVGDRVTEESRVFTHHSHRGANGFGVAACDAALGREVEGLEPAMRDGP